MGIYHGLGGEEEPTPWWLELCSLREQGWLETPVESVMEAQLRV